MTLVSRGTSPRERGIVAASGANASPGPKIVNRSRKQGTLG